MPSLLVVGVQQERAGLGDGDPSVDDEPVRGHPVYVARWSSNRSTSILHATARVTRASQGLGIITYARTSAVGDLHPGSGSWWA